MPKRSRATLKGLALAKLQRLNGAAYRGHPRKTDIGTPPPVRRYMSKAFCAAIMI